MFGMLGGRTSILDDIDREKNFFPASTALVITSSGIPWFITEKRE